jgi:hypothetical protein
MVLNTPLKVTELIYSASHNVLFYDNVLIVRSFRYPTKKWKETKNIIPNVRYFVSNLKTNALVNISNYIPDCPLSRLWELWEMLSHIFPFGDIRASPPGPTLCFLLTVALSGNKCILWICQIISIKMHVLQYFL